MAGINYTREWQRIINQLEITATRLNRMLAEAETSEERNDLKQRLDNIEQQQNTAREWINKHRQLEPKRI